MRKLLKLLDIFEVNLIFCIIPNLFVTYEKRKGGREQAWLVPYIELICKG